MQETEWNESIKLFQSYRAALYYLHESNIYDADIEERKEPDGSIFYMLSVDDSRQKRT